MQAIYFFSDPNEIPRNDMDNELEKSIICKMPHDQFFIRDIKENEKIISFSHRTDDLYITMELKDFIAKDARDFISICVLFDGYKIACEMNEYDFGSLIDYLYQVCENFITNEGSLVIDNEFFVVDSSFLSLLAYFMVRIEKFVVKMNLGEGSSCEEDNLGRSEDMTEITVDLFQSVFFYDSNPTRNPYSTLFDEQCKFESKLFLLRSLKLHNNSLDDKGFEKILNVIEQCTSLTELEISKNFLSEKSLMDLASKIENNKILKNLEKLSFSNNWIVSNKLDDFIRVILDNLQKINLVDLSGNFIDNEFLKRFLICYMKRKIKHPLKSTGGGILVSSTPEILIDITKNRFDLISARNMFYSWFPDDKDKEKPESFMLETFFKNSSHIKLNVKLKLDYIKHYCHLIENVELKDNKMFKEMREKLEMCKYAKFYARTIKGSECVSTCGKTEIQVYQELFQIYYLIDHFFDPFMNSFCSRNALGLGLINQKNSEAFYGSLLNIMEREYNPVKDMNPNVQAQVHLSLHDSINMYQGNAFYSKQRCEIIKKLFSSVHASLTESEVEEFSPNTNVEQLYDFYKYFKSSNLEMPYTALHKYLNRIKIESLLAIRDKDISTTGFLCDINSFFSMSYMEKIIDEHSILRKKAAIINTALKSIINFENNDKDDIFTNTNQKHFFLHELNNFLDIFIKEADMINLKNDLICAAKFVQFQRNNKLRAKFYLIYEDTLKREDMFTYVGDVNSEFDLMFSKYKDIEDYKELRIPEKVNAKILSLHPWKLDYLKISELELKVVESDLEIVSKILADEESYGLRNIHDRIHFFLAYTSDPLIEKNTKFYLHKHNFYLKISRVLFRLFNNLDFPKSDHAAYDIENNEETKSKADSLHSTSEIKSDKNALISYSKLKSVSNQDRIAKKSVDMSQIIEYKKRILAYSTHALDESLVLCLDDLKANCETQFNDIAKIISSKLYEIFDNSSNITTSSGNVINPALLFSDVKDFLIYYFELKECYRKSNYKMWELLNIELTLQICRHINRNNNEYTIESQVIQYCFGFLSLMCLYLDLSQTFLNAFKRWLAFHIQTKYYAECCTTILKNLIRHSTYGCKLFWVPSIFEISNRLENSSIMLPIHFGEDLKEEYPIDETTTAGDLFERIIRDSELLKKAVEKRLYWLYMHHTDFNEIVSVYNEEYLLDIISFSENKYLNSFEAQIANIKISSSFTYENNKRTPKVTFNETESNDPQLRKRSSFSPVNIVPPVEQKENCFNLGLKTESSLFIHLKFIIQRRIFSPAVVTTDFQNISDSEIFILFTQIKNEFLKRNFSVNIADGDTITLCSILIANYKRLVEFEESNSLEVNIEQNLHKFMPKFKKNTINNNENFISLVAKNINEKSLFLQSERYIKEEFLKCLKKYELFFSNVYEVKLTSCNYGNLPDKFLIVITLNYVMMIDCNKFHEMFKFCYTDIVHCVCVFDILTIAIENTTDNTNNQKEVRFELSTSDARIILEDILSYSQLYLALNTKSELTNCHMKEPQISEAQAKLCDMKDYCFVYHRQLPCIKAPPLIACDEKPVARSFSTLSIPKPAFSARSSQDVTFKNKSARTSKLQFDSRRNSTEKNILKTDTSKTDDYTKPPKAPPLLSLDLCNKVPLYPQNNEDKTITLCVPVAKLNNEDQTDEITNMKTTNPTVLMTNDKLSQALKMIPPIALALKKKQNKNESLDPTSQL